jgi:hypothetical protein
MLRGDIVDRAHEKGIDISNECNRALADMLGIDYRQQLLDDRSGPEPVVIAAESSCGEAVNPLLATPLHPVINADDPSAVDHLLKAKRKHNKKETAVDPVTGPALTTEQHEPSPSSLLQVSLPRPHQTGKERRPASGKKQKDDSMKRFVAEKIDRVDSDDAVVPKDIVYQSFVRWLRDHRITLVIDQKKFAVTLKNQFAVSEKIIDGIPNWIGVHLK